MYVVEWQIHKDRKYMSGAIGCEEGEWRVIANGYKVCLGGDEYILKLDSDNSYKHTKNH